MKRLLLTSFTFLAICFSLSAQEIDTVPISVKDMEIKLKRNPLPSRTGVITFQPVDLKPALVQAKINYWKTKATVGINANQASFSDNWKGGGVNSIAIGALLNHKAEYSKESYSYTSEVILQYGKVKNKDQLQKKTNDRIYWDNKAAFQLSKNWYFFASVSFESQFDKGFSYSKDANGNEVAKILSKFMSPGYLTESLGFEYKPSKVFSTRIGTGTARQTFVLDTTIYRTNAKNFGVDIGKRMRNDLAFQIVSNLEKEIMKNTILKAKYNMFIPYEDFGETDHRLDVVITSKLNRFLNVSLTGVILYDKDMDLKVQRSQALALGASFTFPR
ncbi:DUF3078 domain-containing protein [Pedobacter xixiisoli]|uniref:DUF3078 domain-containing protein n=1 Tax=Pedobacter xixiisoli TaxID=1476464 RepID=A0A286ADF1_9SPHI|nr:DUF3078 domain-containing protein [Pedobacter xixiisoli]SOD19928.1 Protein of unknown function [Pedobacter xixiisoli]